MKNEREARRAEFNRVFESIPGTDEYRTARVCEILGYQPHTMRVLRVKKTAWKVIPQSKLDILKRELARAETVAQPKAKPKQKPAAPDIQIGLTL